MKPLIGYLKNLTKEDIEMQYIITEHISTVSAWMQPQGSIFHSGFLGEVQFKFDLKKWTFEPKSEVVFKKNHKKWTFQKHGALFKSEVAFKRIRYVITHRE